MGKYFFLCLVFLIPFSGHSQDESKKVVAVQALFFEESRVDSLWDEAMRDYQADCAKSNGARPHMTIASFLLDDREISEITARFEKLDQHYPAVRIPVKLRSSKRENTITYSLIPAIEDALLTEVHDAVYNSVDNGYSRYRAIDEPGKWRPHVSMFSLPGDQEIKALEFIEKTEQIDSLTIKGFTLVTFPIKYLAEIQVSSDTNN